MDKCIAIPLENGVLCPHFGHCETFAIVKVENNTIKSIEQFNPPEHVPGLYPRWVAQFGVTDVIAGGLGQKAITLFHEQNINVFAGAPIQSPDILVTDFIAGKLQLQANYCNHDSSQHNHGCGH